MIDSQNRPRDNRIVYHYTSVDTLLKIVDKGELWASSSQYLNDIKELDFFLERVRGRIPAYIAAKNIPTREQVIFANILLGRDVGFTQKPFVVSFSAQDDSLPQWRAYCHEGNGVSIGFRAMCLGRARYSVEPSSDAANSAKVRSSISYVPVQYPDEGDNSVVDQWIDACFVLARDKIQTVMSGTVLPETKAHVFDFAIRSVAPYYKHKSFSAEEEFRIVVPPPGEETFNVEFRSIRSTLLPYIRLSIPRAEENHLERLTRDELKLVSERHQFIDRVVIGPSPKPDLTKQALDSFFIKHGMAVEVKASDSPFRNWL